MDSLKHNETTTETLQSPALSTESESDLRSSLRRIEGQLQSRASWNLSQNLGRGGAWLFKQIAAHVLILLLGATATGWWMMSDDSWKSYVYTGCNPAPSNYSQRFTPEPPPDRPDTWKELVDWQSDYVHQLILVNTNLNMDRDSIRAACSP